MDHEPDATTDYGHRVKTAAQDSIVRLALGIWVFDPRAGLTEDHRQRILKRLHDTERLVVPFTTVEKAWIRRPLLVFLKDYYPRIADIVAKQFTEGPYGETSLP